jgi:hypothetical protein
MFPPFVLLVLFALTVYGLVFLAGFAVVFVAGAGPARWLTGPGLGSKPGLLLALVGLSVLGGLLAIDLYSASSRNAAEKERQQRVDEARALATRRHNNFPSS